MKVLNAYAGIGGNRKLWTNVEVTAVERNEAIANEYHKLFPDDKLRIKDAHEYILDNYRRFDFIWSSPPCQSHTQLMRIHNNRDNERPRYPDFRLYEEIIFLKENFKGLWVVENVNPYYQPLVRPSLKLGRHLFWSNFRIRIDSRVNHDFTRHNNMEEMAKALDFPSVKRIQMDKGHPEQVFRNCVHPIIGEQIMASARGHQSAFRKPACDTLVDI